MFIDSHCHLFYEDFAEDIGEVIARANDAGVGAFVVPATNLETARQALAMAERFPNLYVCAGFHPLDLGHFSEEHFTAVRDMLGHPRVVAVGEIGIDYFYDRSPKEFQKEVFSRHIALAIEHDLPIVVHTRDSVQDAIDIVLDHVARRGDWMSGGDVPDRKRGVFHCFTGTADQARILFDHRFLVSFPGPITFKKSGMPEVLKEIGIDNVMIETDAPFLAPVPYRGKRNEPAHVVVVAQKIAELLSMTVEDVAARTARNAVQLFNLPVAVS